MIGGINSISKAITDKDLIKPIPTLSTGTMASASVSTDSNGGLTAPTLAIVNDRGVGNAPGGVYKRLYTEQMEHLKRHKGEMCLFL